MAFTFFPLSNCFCNYEKNQLTILVSLFGFSILKFHGSM